MKKTYTGGCHCGRVRFEADLDLDAGTSKCNCSICTKARWWGATTPPQGFRLLAGEADLSQYQFGERKAHHLFCRHCGVRSYVWSDVEEMGGVYYNVNLLCLDDVDLDELLAAPLSYQDGHNNNWWNAPAETRHL